MIKKLDINDMWIDNGIRDVANAITDIIEKRNETIDALNAQQKPKSERTLWVNKDCEVVEFCCERLKRDFKHKGVMQSVTEYEEINRGCVRKWKDLQGCPYCRAPIRLRVSSKEEPDRIRITLDAIDAFTLEWMLKKKQQTERYKGNVALFARIRAEIEEGERIE